VIFLTGNSDLNVCPDNHRRGRRVDFSLFSEFCFSPKALHNDLFIDKNKNYWLGQLANVTYDL